VKKTPSCDDSGEKSRDGVWDVNLGAVERHGRIWLGERARARYEVARDLGSQSIDLTNKIEKDQNNLAYRMEVQGDSVL
jgi:hypothetical protein